MDHPWRTEANVARWVWEPRCAGKVQNVCRMPKASSVMSLFCVRLERWQTMARTIGTTLLRIKAIAESSLLLLPQQSGVGRNMHDVPRPTGPDHENH